MARTNSLQPVRVERALKSYKSALCDNQRWHGFPLRTSDIFVCSAPKSGTTWVQSIVASLLWPDGNLPDAVMELSPWMESTLHDVNVVHEKLGRQSHRRFLKSHMPADGIPWFDEGKYIFVARDCRDVFMSWYNHVSRMRACSVGVSGIDESVAVPALSGDEPALTKFFTEWLSGDNSCPRIVGSYWSRRHRENLLLVHYNDLLENLSLEMSRIATFLGIEVPSELWPDVVQRCTFEEMRARGREIGSMTAVLAGGIQAFLYKGTNGRWRNVLSDEALSFYRKMAASVLPSDCIIWLERTGDL